MNCECNTKNYGNMLKCDICNKLCHEDCYGKINEKYTSFYCYKCRIFLLNPFYKENLVLLNKYNFKDSKWNINIGKSNYLNNSHIFMILLYENKNIYGFKYFDYDFTSVIKINEKKIQLNKLLFFEEKLNNFTNNPNLVIDIENKENKKFYLFISIGLIDILNDNFVYEIMNNSYKSNFIELNNLNTSIKISSFSKNTKTLVPFIGSNCKHTDIPLNLEYYFYCNYYDYLDRIWHCYICNEIILIKDIIILDDLFKYIYSNKNKIMLNNYNFIKMKDKIFDLTIIDEYNIITIDTTEEIQENENEIDKEVLDNNSNKNQSIITKEEYKEQIIKSKKLKLKIIIENTMVKENFDKMIAKLISNDINDFNLYIKQFSKNICLKLNNANLNLIEGFLISNIFSYSFIENKFNIIEYFIFKSYYKKEFFINFMLGLVLGKDKDYNELNLILIGDDKYFLYYLKTRLLSIYQIIDKFNNKSPLNKHLINELKSLDCLITN